MTTTFRIALLIALASPLVASLLDNRSAAAEAPVAAPAHDSNSTHRVVGNPGSPNAVNNCGNAATAPQIFSNTLASPQALSADGSVPANWNPYHGLMMRAGIAYVAGDGLRYELVTDNCTYISAVSVGSTALSANFSNGYWFSALPSLTPPADPARSGYSLTIFYPTTYDGSTDQVMFSVGRIGGSATTTYSVPVVHVRAVYATSQDPTYVDAPVTISRAEMWNRFTKALYKTFNGPTNSFNLTNADGSPGRRLYGYDPSSFQLTMDTSGISFDFKFKADVSYWCDADVRAYGTFKLTAVAANGIGIQWNQGSPQASTSESWYCQYLDVVPILGEITHLITTTIQGDAQTGVLGGLTGAIAGSLPTESDQAQLLLDGTEYLNNEARVLLKIQLPSVEIQVPYDAFALGRTGTMFANNDPIVLVASGLGMYDYVANSSPRTSLWSGPNGVPLAGSATSWPNPETVARTEPLAYPGRPLANLLFRRSSSIGEATYGYSDGCVDNTDSPELATSRFIVFGVNDTAADAARERGSLGFGYSLRVFFINGLYKPKPDAVCSMILAPHPAHE
jgi:hypothetical protein